MSVIPIMSNRGNKYIDVAYSPSLFPSAAIGYENVVSKSRRQGLTSTSVSFDRAYQRPAKGAVILTWATFSNNLTRFLTEFRDPVLTRARRLRSRLTGIFSFRSLGTSWDFDRRSFSLERDRPRDSRSFPSPLLTSEANPTFFLDFIDIVW